MKTLSKISIMVLAAMLFLASCKKGESTEPMQGNVGGEPRAQSFNVKMTDAPGDYEGLDVKVVGVEAYLEGQGWVELDSRAQAIDVLDLTNGAEVTLAQKANAQIGVYTKLKVKFDADAKLTLNANAMAEGGGGSILSDNTLQLTWEGPREIEIAINEEVTANAGADVLLDFDVAQSIVKDVDQYMLKPTIREIKQTQTGIRGEVEGTVAAAITLTDGQTTFSTFIDVNGNFMLRGIKPGIYKMIILPAKAAAGQMQPAEKEIQGVVIVQGEIRNMGQIAL